MLLNSEVGVGSKEDTVNAGWWALVELYVDVMIPIVVSQNINVVSEYLAILMSTYAVPLLLLLWTKTENSKVRH